jgi:glycosyltransferase involved in cell wall biosynthesis
MHIAIDVSRANQGQRTGPASYAWNVVRGIMQNIEHRTQNTEIRNFETSEHQFYLLAPEDPLPEWGTLPSNVSWKKLRWIGPGWTKLRLPLHLRRVRYNVFWQPSSGLPRLPGKTKGICTIHDVSFLEAPDIYERADLLRQRRALASVCRATKIITVSDYTQRLLIERVGIPAAKISVTPLAADDGMAPVGLDGHQALLGRYNIRTPYIITASRIEKKKGIVEIVQALIQLPNDVQLVLAGRDGYGSDEVRQRIVELKLEERVKFVGWVPDSDLTCLLSGAACYVSACRYEGFGIAVINALACGCPVVAYRAGAVPETVGDAAVLVDPSGPDALAAGIRSVLESESERQRLSQAGIIRASEFSWQRTARQTISCLTEW